MKYLLAELENIKNNGLERTIPNIQFKSGNNIVIDDKSYFNFASNDYLNISTKLDLREKFLSENKSLMSSASARLLSGTASEYNDLELTLADLFNKDAALIFNTGYQCNLGIISTLCQKGDIVFSDKLNHASIIDGMRLAEGDFLRYKHLDYEHLESLLATKRGLYNRAIIVSESVFSMDGDKADIDRLIELKNRYNCLLMVDEAHAFCAWGESLAGLSYNKDVDIITATFGKALGSFGAFCVSNKDIIKYLTNKARSFIFSTSIPPINIAWSNWLLNEQQTFLIEQKNKLQTLSNEVHNILDNQGTHIVPIVIGDNDKTLSIAEYLKSLGYYIPAIRPPTVANGSARLRLSLTADMELDIVKKVLLSLNEFLHLQQ